MQSEWALVTCGCAAALLQITAACMAGTDPELMCLLPDASHPDMKTDVLVQRDQRDDYDAAVRMAGAPATVHNQPAPANAAASISSLRSRQRPAHPLESIHSPYQGLSRATVAALATAGSSSKQQQAAASSSKQARVEH